MRYIDKSEKFDLLDKYKDLHKELQKPWDEFKNPDKTVTHNYILRTQKYLCAYCQQKLRERDNSYSFGHLEHIIPRDESKELTFDYSNLVVCCQGFDIEEYREKIKSGVIKRSEEFCAPKKGSEHNQNLFLNPVTVKDIEDYFDYASELDENDPRNKSYLIIPDKTKANEDKSKADYTINLMLLNHKILKKMRAKQYEVVANKIRECKNNQVQIDEFLNNLLDKESNIFPAFFSMLKKEFSVWHS